MPDPRDNVHPDTGEQLDHQPGTPGHQPAGRPDGDHEHDEQ